MALAHRTGCWREEAAPDPFRQFQRLPAVLCPKGKPASAAQWRRRLAPHPAGRTRGGALAAAQGQVQEPRGGRAGCNGARVRGRARQGGARALGARRQGVVQVAAGAESEPYLDFRPGDRALLHRQVSIGALCVSRLRGFAFGGARGRIALGASRIPRAAAAAAAAAAATVAAAVLGGIAQQTAQTHCGGRGSAGAHRHAASGLGARGSLTCGRCRRRPAPGHLAKWATLRGWKSKSLTRPPERAPGSGGRSSVPVPAPTRTERPSAPSFLSLEWRWRSLSSTHPAPEGLTDPCATPRRRGTGGSPYWLSTPLPGPPRPALQPTVPPPGN